MLTLANFFPTLELLKQLLAHSWKQVLQLNRNNEATICFISDIFDDNETSRRILEDI